MSQPIPMLRAIASGVLVGLRLTLGVLLLYSAIAKLRQPYDFLDVIYGYELVSPTLGVVVAAVLPWVEFILAVFLIGGLWLGGALIACAVLGGIFVFTQWHAIQSGLTIACGCFGSSSSHPTPAGWGTFLRAVAMLVGTVILAAAWFISPAQETAGRVARGRRPQARKSLPPASP